MKHLVTLNDVTNDEVLALFETAKGLLPSIANPKLRTHPLAGKTLATAFYENSTRTRLSFNLAGQYLGMHVVDLSVATASVQKGETVGDTLATLAAMGLNAVALRHSSESIHPDEALPICEQTGMALLNAGAGKTAHPTQALLDAFTLWQQWDGNFTGKTLAMVGDIAHSRVAASNVVLLQRLGITVRCVAPAAWQPTSEAFATVEKFDNLTDGLAGVDAVMALRIQRERHEGGGQTVAVENYQVSHEALTMANPGVVVLHPGPMNRGVEITDAVADDPAVSLIAQQVTHGVAIRMALLQSALI